MTHFSMPQPEALRACCRRIFLRDLTLTCRIGAYPQERLAPQRVVFNADVWVYATFSSSTRDALEDTLNYDLIVDIFKEEASGPHIALQETLIDRIAKRITALPGVALVRAEVSKPDAYSDAGAVGIEVWRAPASPSERTIQ